MRMPLLCRSLALALGAVALVATPSEASVAPEPVGSTATHRWLSAAGPTSPLPAPRATAPLAAVPVATQPLIFGASGGSEVNALALRVGAPLATHAFGQLDGPVPASARLVNMATNVPWRTVAAAQPGSTVYNNIVRWADGLKARSGTIMFTFSHEPEGASSAAEKLGTAPEFIAAFRRVEAIFDARGVQNVEFTWNMTSNSFRVKPTDRRYAAKWYPGDAYVDNVATAAYNWYNCGEGKGLWLSLADRAAAPLAFAKAHGKHLVLAEWASQADSRRAQWLSDARQFLLSNKASMRAAFYYQSPTPRAGCSWMLTSTAEISAFAQMARDRLNFGG
jgi:hypothetical protein